MKKLFTLSLVLAACASVSADNLSILSMGVGEPGTGEPQIMGLGISANGEYITGALEMGIGFFVANRVTGEIKWEIADSDDGGELRHVDNNGLAIGFTDDGILYSFEDEEVTFLPIPAGQRGNLGEDLTNDGSLIVGSLTTQTFTTYGAYTTDRANWTLLPIPTQEELGPNLKISEGSAAKLVSGDGKVIAGFLGSFTFPIIWTLDDNGEYKYDLFAKDLLKFTEEDILDESRPLYGLSAMYLNLSNNGRYLSMVGLIKNEKDDYLNIPVIYDIEKKKAILYTDPQHIDPEGAGLWPSAIADDGTFIGCIGQPYFYSQGSFIWKAGQPAAELYNDAFPAFEEKLGESDKLGFNVPTGLSADGKYLLGYTFYSDDFYDNSPAYYITYIIDREEEVSVKGISEEAADARPVDYYSIDGRRTSGMEKGLNIIRMSDGTTRKIWIK